MPETSKQIPKQTLRAVAQSLVIRAREGDENAMAMIVSVRENASKGNARAIQSLDAIKQYIAANPTPETDADIGAEAEVSIAILKDVGPIVGLSILLDLPKSGDDALFAASILLANGKAISETKIHDISLGLKTPEEQELFTYAIENSHRNIADESLALPLVTKKAFYAGLCIGLARNIQLVRQPKSKITRFSRMAGWELGE